MKYSLDCHIITNNSGIRNAVKQLIPSINDPRVWGGEYKFKEDLNEDGIMVFHCMVRLYTEDDRNGVLSSVKGLTGIIHACEKGSVVKGHKCFHDETPQKPCEPEPETEMRKS